MKDAITTILVPPSSASLNAVFLTEHGVRRKLALLAGIQHTGDDNKTSVSLEAMIYVEAKQAWFRAKEASGFLGVEFAEHPNDWSAHVREFEARNSAMEQEAARIADSIQRDQAAIRERQRINESFIEQPVNRYTERHVMPPPPSELPPRIPASQIPSDGRTWKKPMENVPVEEQPASPQLTDKQRGQRLFKF